MSSKKKYADLVWNIPGDLGFKLKLQVLGLAGRSRWTKLFPETNSTFRPKDVYTLNTAII